MIKREFEYINGSTAVKPKRKVEKKRDDRYEEYRKAKIRSQKRKKEKLFQKYIAVGQIAVAVLVVGSVVLHRDGLVYGLKQDLKAVNTDIKVLKDENEAMRVDLLKNSSLKNIEANAMKKVKMIEGSEAERVSVDLSKNYLGDLLNEK